MHLFDMITNNIKKISSYSNESDIIKAFAALTDREMEIIADNSAPEAEAVRQKLKQMPVDMDLLQSLGLNTKRLGTVNNLYELFYQAYPTMPKSIIRDFIKSNKPQEHTFKDFINEINSLRPDLTDMLYDEFDRKTKHAVNMLILSIFEDKEIKGDEHWSNLYIEFNKLISTKSVGYVLGTLYSMGAPFNKLLGIVEMIVENYESAAIGKRLISSLQSTQMQHSKQHINNNYNEAEILRESDTFDTIRNSPEYKQLLAKHKGEDLSDREEDLVEHPKQNDRHVSVKGPATLPNVKYPQSTSHGIPGLPEDVYRNSYKYWIENEDTKPDGYLTEPNLFINQSKINNPDDGTSTPVDISIKENLPEYCKDALEEERKRIAEEEKQHKDQSSNNDDKTIVTKKSSLQIAYHNAMKLI